MAQRKEITTFALGDPHGALKAIKQCFERSMFNKEKDRLIVLGDVADGWSEVYESVEELMTVKNLIYILGNHDDWLRVWLNNGSAPSIWTSQGGRASISSYKSTTFRPPERINEHKRFFNNALPYYVDEQNRLYVHGGFNPYEDIEKQSAYDLMWDRDLFYSAMKLQKFCETHPERSEQPIVDNYKEVFIGHTSTSWFYPELKPVHVSNVWNLDQGAGWEGKLTIMNVDTKEYWQSDIVKTLYPNEKGRR